MTTKVQEPFKGTIQFNRRRMLEYIAGYYQSVEVIGELVDNSRDARATRIYVVLEADSIRVIDNGKGMSARGQDSSLEAMMERVANSSKDPSKDTNVRGMRAIGFWAWQDLGQAVAVFSRQADKATMRLDPLSGANPEDVEYTISETTPLKGPNQKEMTHGTTVQITQLLLGIYDLLRPSTLTEYLRRQFGQDVAGGMELIVIDRITPEGRKTNYGQEYRISPMEYPGALVLETELYVMFKKVSIVLYYNPEAKRQFPQIRRQGRGVSNLTGLQEFEHRQPWANGRLIGHIDYSWVGGDDWDTAKKYPKHTEERKAWVKALKQLEPMIIQQIADIQQRLEDYRVDKVSDTIASVVSAAMSELGAFSQFSLRKAIGGKKAPTTTTKRSSKVQIPTPSIEVRVVDEHGQGFRSASITLSKGKTKTPVATHYTSASGYVRLNNVQPGMYSVRLTVPETTEAVGPTEITFHLIKDRPEFSTTFQIKTGTEAPPPRKKVARIRVWRHPIPNVDLYLNRLDVGTVEINSEYKPLKEAVKDGNFTRVNEIIAFCVASAIASYYLRGDQDFILEQAALLAIKLLMLADEKGDKKKK